MAAEPEGEAAPEDGPVVVTNRGGRAGGPRYDCWRAPVPNDGREDLAQALVDELVGDVEFVVPRLELEPRPVDLDDR